MRRSDRLRPPAVWRFLVNGTVLGACSGGVVAAAVSSAFVLGLLLVGVRADAPIRAFDGTTVGVLAGAVGGAVLAGVLVPLRWTGPTRGVRVAAAGWAALAAVLTGRWQLDRVDGVTLDGTTVLLVAAAALAAALWWALVPLLWRAGGRTPAGPPPSERPRRSDRHVRR